MASVAREYFANTSFHGIRYLVEPDRHWTERTIWLTCCISSWIASGLLMYASWYDYQNNAISFVVETNYLDWDTNFPSVAVCEFDNQEAIAETSDKIFGDPHDYNLDDMVNELVFYRGVSYYILQLCKSENSRDPHCPLGDFAGFEEYVRKPCPSLFRRCEWNGVEFDCCAHFARIDTEMGTCYVINSNQAREKKPPYKMVSNFRTGPGAARFELNGINNVYLLSPDEVPTLASSPVDIISISPQIHYRRYFAIKDVENHREVHDVNIAQRNCRFGDESNLDVYKRYSYSACIVQCRKDRQMSLCNCSHYYVPNSDPVRQCDIAGMDCLNRHYNDLSVLKPGWSQRDGLVCRCIPSCNDMEMTTIRNEKFGIYEEIGIVELVLERLPTERFKRNVVRGKLDMVVSMGGSAGLFVGASILSFVELVYYFTLRLGNTLRNQPRRNVI